MPNEDKKILKYNHGEKSLKVPFMIYVESLLEKTSCQIDSKQSYTHKKANQARLLQRGRLYGKT